MSDRLDALTPIEGIVRCEPANIHGVRFEEPWGYCRFCHRYIALDAGGMLSLHLGYKGAWKSRTECEGSDSRPTLPASLESSRFRLHFYPHSGYDNWTYSDTMIQQSRL